MKAFVFFCVFFIANASIGYAQRKKIITEDLKAYQHAFYLRPLNAIDYSHPRISAGYEKMVAPRNFLSLTTSFYFHNFYVNRPDSRYINFTPKPAFGISGELEHKWFKKKLFYYAASIHVGNIGYFSSLVYEKRQAGVVISEYVAKFNASKWWAEPNAKIGWRVRPSNRLFLDFYLGAGIRFKNTEFTNDDIYPGYEMFKEFNLFIIRDQPGFFVGPTFKSGISFGYKFTSRNKQ
jgi:hypothetical protein